MVQEEESVHAPDEQYQFIDDGNASDQFEMVEDEPMVAAVGADGSGLGGILGQVKTFSEERRGLFLAIVLLFSVTIVYQFMGSSDKKSHVQASSKSQHVAEAQKGASKQHGKAMAAAAHGDAIAHLQAEHSGMHEQLTAVQQATHDNVAHVNRMQNDLQQSQMHVTQLSRQNQLLVTELNRLNAEVNKLNHKVFPAPAKAAPLSYTIQAIVPGRAWLASNRGETMTVQVGTELSSYGTVRQINADAGLVMTSSGKLIRFSLNR